MKTSLHLARLMAGTLLLMMTAGLVSIASADSEPGGIIGTIPPTSKFAKISIGMPMKEVFDLIGPPTDSRS